MYFFNSGLLSEIVVLLYTLTFILWFTNQHYDASISAPSDPFIDIKSELLFLLYTALVNQNNNNNTSFCRNLSVCVLLL